MDENDEYTIEALPANKLQAIDLVVLVLEYARRLFAATETLFEDLATVVCEHANYRVEREEVADAMRRDIERIVSE